MAKRKTPKVKDLRPEKVTDEQLKKVQEAVNAMNRTQMEIGQLETRKHELVHNIAVVKDGLTVLQSESHVLTSYCPFISGINTYQ